MPKLLAWCVTTQPFLYHPALHLPVGLSAVQQMRERVTGVYAMLDASARNGRERTTLHSHPLALRVAGGGLFHMPDDYDEMPPHTERGHLIADVFGGDDDERNLVPMSRMFNQQTWKSQVEASFTQAAALRAGELLGIKIDVGYDGGDPRIPSRYQVNLYSFGAKDALRLKVGWQNVLAGPNAVFGDIPRGYQQGIVGLWNPFNYRHIGTKSLTPGLPGPLVPDSAETVVGTMTLRTLRRLADEIRFPLLEARADVQRTGWKLEDTGEALWYNFKLPPPHRRPYAALDYMLEQDVLQRLHPAVANKTLHKCFTGKGFADWKRELIFAANMVFNNQESFLISDNEDDDVYRQVVVDYSAPSGGGQMGRYEFAVREWVKATGLDPRLKVPRGALFLDSTAYAPQVDHVIAKAGSGTGIDAFSNAQVVSGRWNRTKSDHEIEPGTITRRRQV